jgi:hypothetical protein
MKNSKCLICLAGAIFCSIAMADSLKFKFVPGDNYSLVSVVEQKTSRMIDGNEENSTQTIQLECELSIEEVDENGVTWARYTYKRVTMKFQSPRQKLEFDSDVNQTKTPFRVIPFRLAIGESTYLLITPQGRIEKINGLQAVITSAKAKTRGVPGAGELGQSIERQFAEAAVRRDLEYQLAVFPDSNGMGSRRFTHSSASGEANRETSQNDAARTGDIWSRREIFSSAELGSLQADNIDEVNIIIEKTFRLNHEKSSKGGIALIDVNLIVRPEVAQVANTQISDKSDVMRANREISGEGAGQIEIEETTGRIISNKIAQETVERIKLIAPSQMLRPPPGPEPLITHTVTTFQMTRTAEGKPAQPADANEKGAP